MSENERAKRPILDRSAPVRSWTGLVIPPEAKPGAAGAKEANVSPVDDVIVRSVELGYRVIDEYVKRGQAAAERMQHGTYGAGDMARDAQGVAAQLVRSATDLAGAWAEFFALATRDGNGQSNDNASVPSPPSTAAAPPSTPAPPPSVPPAPAAAGAAASAEQATPSPTPAGARPPVPAVWRVRLAVRATRPVETVLDLLPVPIDRLLVVQALRGEGAARIADVSLERHDDGVAVVTVQVPPDQPAGRYTALVVDDGANVPVGELTIVVPPA